MAKTNSENGYLADGLFDWFDSIVERSRVTRAVADKQSVRAMFLNFLNRHIRRKNRDFDSPLDEMPQDILFGTAIERDDMQTIPPLDFAELPFALTFFPGIFAFRFDGLHPIGSFHGSGFFGALDEICVI